eukprot:TRINITY_DN20631_c0_g1_i1.p6 TRINITY_DN20631_c0_g1~~TRINITY_DN20631_c0_g1_i1.p6  ORF type:complete len:127 (-),score=13.44 TRINITY_DN20631_c0_g1_i1:913-1293(-)
MHKNAQIFHGSADNFVYVGDIGDGFLISTVLYQLGNFGSVGYCEIAMHAYGSNYGDKQVVKRLKSVENMLMSFPQFSKPSTPPLFFQSQHFFTDLSCNFRQLYQPSCLTQNGTVVSRAVQKLIGIY